MKLKGLLKGFFILGLTLLPISFSSAGNTWPVGTYGTSPYDTNFDLNVLSKGTLLTNKLGYTRNMLYFTDSSNKAFLYRGSSGIPYVYLYAPANPHTRDVFIQGQFLNYYVCNEISPSSTDLPSGCSSSAVGDLTRQIFFDFFSTITSDDYRYFDFKKDGNFGGGINSYQYNRARLNVCFSSSYAGKSICFNTCSVTQWGGSTVTCSSNSFNNYTNSVVDLFNFGTGITFDNFNGSYLYSSPGLGNNGGSSLSGGSQIIDVRDSAQNIYDSYRKMGYSDTLCYVGFSLDNIIGSGASSSSFRDIQIGGGASLTELYNYYSGGFSSSNHLSFVDWYNDWDFEYGFFVDDPEYELTHYYMGKPKGFVGAFMIKDKYFKGDNFDPQILKSFCDFSYSNAPYIDKDKTPINIIGDTLTENEINQLIGDIGVIIPSSGSSLDVFLDYMGGGGYSEDDFYRLLDSGYNAISSLNYVGTDPNLVGILPTYIIVGFIGIFLLYVFKH